MSDRTRTSVLIFTALLCTALLLIVSCGEPTAEFCEIAATSSQGRTQNEIDAYYEELASAAPAEIKDDVETLQEGWTQVSFPLGGDSLSRPDEISEAARSVHAYVGEVCGTQGGVYLVHPEIGF